MQFTMAMSLLMKMKQVPVAWPPLTISKKHTFFSSYLISKGSGRGLVVRDSIVMGSIPTLGGHGSLLKLRQFHLTQFASVHCK